MDMNDAVQLLGKYGNRIRFCCQAGKFNAESVQRYLGFNRIGYAWHDAANEALPAEEQTLLAKRVAESKLISEVSVHVTYRQPRSYWHKDEFEYRTVVVGAIAPTLNEAAELLYNWLETLQTGHQYETEAATVFLVNAPEKENGHWN